VSFGGAQGKDEGIFLEGLRKEAQIGEGKRNETGRQSLLRRDSKAEDYI